MRRTKRVLTAAALALVVATAAGAAVAPIKKYAVGIAGGYETKRLLSVGDTVPETSNPAKAFKMVGIPDGLGARTQTRTGRRRST
ncbi:MAG: hypothetical protein ABR583_04280 [Gaiellaceae bacterium]